MFQRTLIACISKGTRRCVLTVLIALHQFFKKNFKELWKWERVLLVSPKFLSSHQSCVFDCCESSAATTLFKTVKFAVSNSWDGLCFKNSFANCLKYDLLHIRRISQRSFCQETEAQASSFLVSQAAETRHCVLSSEHCRGTSQKARSESKWNDWKPAQHHGAYDGCTKALKKHLLPAH